MGPHHGGPRDADLPARLATSAWLVILVALALMTAVSVSTVTGWAPFARDGGDSTQRLPPSGPVTIAFGGDVHFESWLRDRVLATPNGALQRMATLFADADLSVVNLETAITERGTPAPKRHTFHGPPQGLTALASAGVDVVSVANNHGMDFGVEGLEDTLRAATDAGLAVVGGGMTELAAYAPHRVRIKGRRVAVFGATQVLDSFALDAWNPGPDRPGLASAKSTRSGVRRLLAGVRRAAASDDTVVVMLHWGRERRQCPLPRQRRLARQLAAAGADVIVGGHAHRLGPGGLLGDAVVHYGLGNLIFYSKDGPGTDSGVLAVTIAADDSTTVDWRPATLHDGVAGPLRGEQRAVAAATWDALRSCTALTAGTDDG